MNPKAGVTFNATSDTITVNALAVASPLTLSFSSSIPSNFAPASATEAVAITTEAQPDPNLANNMANVSEAINHPPTAIQLSSNTVVEFAANGTVVGTLTDTDPDAGDTAAFTLTNSFGGAYAISGNQVVVANGSLISYSAAAQDSVTVQVTDKGGLTYSQIINIQVQDKAATAVNDTYTTLENQALTTTATTSVLANDTIPDGTAHATAILVTGPAHGTLTLNANGSFTYTPTTYFSGSDSFTYKVVENGTLSSNVATDTLNVTYVNQAPSFALSTNTVNIAENTGTDTIANFATNIMDGPGDHSSQTLNFIVTNNNNVLFSTQPTINSLRDSFTLAPNQTGTATVSVELMDNGSTANGGINTSATETFNIVIAPSGPAIIYVNQVTLLAQPMACPGVPPSPPLPKASTWPASTPQPETQIFKFGWPQAPIPHPPFMPLAESMAGA